MIYVIQYYQSEDVAPVGVLGRSLPALVLTFEEIYEKTGDAEAHGIATLLAKYKTVACIYMLSDAYTL